MADTITATVSVRKSEITCGFDSKGAASTKAAMMLVGEFEQLTGFGEAYSTNINPKNTELMVDITFIEGQDIQYRFIREGILYIGEMSLANYYKKAYIGISLPINMYFYLSNQEAGKLSFEAYYDVVVSQKHAGKQSIGEANIRSIKLSRITSKKASENP